MTHYLSLLVHEQPSVVRDQIENFSRWAPKLRVVVHVSPSASFSPQSLEEQLGVRDSARGAIVNPAQHATSWSWNGGDRVPAIFRAHVENLRVMLERGDAQTISFASSNDLLVRPGLITASHGLKTRWNRVPIGRNFGWYWRDAALQFLRDFDIAVVNSIHSQVEGTTYPAEWVKSVFAVLEGAASVAGGFPLEEVLLPSLASRDGLHPEAHPFTFSEVHRGDYAVSRVTQLVGRREGRQPLLPTTWARQVVRQAALWRQIRPLSVEDVTRVRAETLPDRDLRLSAGMDRMPIYSRSDLFGVKRVARSMADPLRLHIRGLLAE